MNLNFNFTTKDIEQFTSAELLKISNELLDDYINYISKVSSLNEDNDLIKKSLYLGIVNNMAINSIHSKLDKILHNQQLILSANS